MNVIPFTAENAADALAQIQAELGPHAVVLNVRQLPARGLTRLWKRSAGIEVLACLPEPDPVSAALAIPVVPPAQTTDPAPPSARPTREAPANCDVWAQCRHYMERNGLLPVYADQIVEEVRASRGTSKAGSLTDELGDCRRVLQRHWREPNTLADRCSPQPHVLIGPPGSGKTTVLCKWLAHSVLNQGMSARVGRLERHSANTAESLSVYGEILGVPVERFWGSPPELDRMLNLVDVPGIDVGDEAASAALSGLLRELPHAHVHLVLNGAYEPALLLTQINAFSRFDPQDLTVTHLDEEGRWGKLWNAVLGTKCSLRFLSAGQNIPGKLLAATAEQLFPTGFWPTEPISARNMGSAEPWQTRC
jgi:flagellar biosynthesis protein FlhF